jgi:hypothetical protein
MSHRVRRGYILITTLFAIAISVILMVGVANRSLALARRASERTTELQIRWGGASIERAAFDRAGAILSRELVLDTVSGGGVRMIPRAYQLETIRLSGTVYDIELFDEQAKMNLNLFANSRSIEKTEALLKERVPALQFDGSIRLRPADENYSLSIRRQSPFDSWGQIANFENHDSIDAINTIRALSQDFTMWGEGGRLQFHAASDWSLDTTAALAIGKRESGNLVELRNGDPGVPIADILDRLALGRDRREKLESILTEQSNTFSLWLRAQRGIYVQTRYVVRDGVSDSTFRTYVISW